MPRQEVDPGPRQGMRHIPQMAVDGTRAAPRLVRIGLDVSRFGDHWALLHPFDRCCAKLVHFQGISGVHPRRHSQRRTFLQ
jgi:hypothetical protein